MKCFINKHNKRIVILTRNAKQNNTTNDTRTCNCRRTDECPAAGKCLTKRVVYQADVTTKNLKKENKDFSIKWSIIKRDAAYKPGSKRFNLCLEDKLLLVKAE